RYSVSLWIWNGFPVEGRPVAGWFVSRGQDYSLSPVGDHLGLGGSAGDAGRLIFQHGRDPANRVAGRTDIPRWQWQHVVLVRDGRNVRVWLNGKLEIETATAGTRGDEPGMDHWYFGGRSDRDSGWEGRLDEIAVFDRPLKPATVAE